MSERLGWDAFVRGTIPVSALGMRIDTSTMPIDDGDRRRLAPLVERAFARMADLESGAVANPDEGRMVGHYWLRAPALAPSEAIRAAIETTRDRVLAFGEDIRAGRLVAPGGAPFRHVVVLGIGGSALGPQLAADALGHPRDPLSVSFLDNTDPDGIARTLDALGDGLGAAIGVVVSKSGGTPETRNALELLAARLERHGLDAPPRLVAVTGEGSALARRAAAEGWLATFPMWDWVGGRTSQTSAVGLLPMSLAGHDAAALLDGARRMDQATRVPDAARNPAAELALSWHVAAGGAGRRDMVVIPYSDRLALFSRYLQQLVMESLGKERDLDGRVVRQGLTVYGNKGSTDQHAYIQQLRDGVDNYFVTLLGTLEDGGDPAAAGAEVESGVTAGDYLGGFLLGTRRALAEGGRMVQAIAVPRVDARTLGALIALYERAVGLYAAMVNINAYHQPGVEAGKREAAAVLELQRAVVQAIGAERGTFLDAPGWAGRAGRPDRAVETLWILERLAANGRGGVARRGDAGDPSARFGAR